MPPESELHYLYNSITVPYLLNFNLIWGRAANIHLKKLLIQVKCEVILKKTSQDASDARYRALSVGPHCI